LEGVRRTSGAWGTAQSGSGLRAISGSWAGGSLRADSDLRVDAASWQPAAVVACDGPWWPTGVARIKEAKGAVRVPTPTVRPPQRCRRRLLDGRSVDRRRSSPPLAADPFPLPFFFLHPLPPAVSVCAGRRPWPAVSCRQSPTRHGSACYAGPQGGSLQPRCG
jgi:hypothetical protein